MAFTDIPEELRKLPQWISWRHGVTDDGKLTKLPLCSRNGKLASCTDPRDWTDFDTAVNAVSQCDGIGFVFTTGDPFAGIDFDNKQNDPDVHRRIMAQLLEFGSYSEVTPSGFGAHCIVMAKLPGKGRRRGNVEIYDNARFFTFTGNVISRGPIIDRQQMTADLWQSLGGTETEETKNVGTETETRSDDEICEAAKAAVNGAKFERLFSGDWETDYGDKSQSEADFALVNILAFYSRNLTQTVRLFRASGLGQRTKAQRGPYVNHMARRAFDRMPAIVTALPGAQWFDARLVEPWPNANPPAILGLPVPAAVRTEASVTLPAVSALPAIPGLVGQMMAHCWHRSTYPVPEVAIASALSSMAVLAGRTYHFNGRGLSLYLLLLAKTSVGKSFGYQAQHAWQNALLARYNNPNGGAQYKLRADFLEGMITGKIGSGPGIAQHVVRHPNTLCQYDEFVKTMKRIGHTNANINDIAIQEELLSLTDASQPGSIYREKRYSDRSGKVKLPSVIAPAFSLFGTGTPEEFYDDLNSGILEGGFLPRFTILEYDGTLPEKNKHVIKDIDTEMLNQIAFHFNKAFELNEVINGQISQIHNVEADAAATLALYNWERHCEANVRKAHSENVPMAGIWSRAMMHVSQIAALIAIGVNPHFPMVTLEHVGIARGLVEPGILRLGSKLGAGETGTGDNRLEAEIRKLVNRIRREGYLFAKSYPGINHEIIATKYIQQALLKWYCCKMSVFIKHKLGANRAFDDTINAMINAGEFERKGFRSIGTANKEIKALLPLW